MKNRKEFDIVIIGGGFYGVMLSLFFKSIFKKVIILEKEADLLTKASYNNQARVHNGYHYPRNFVTALRSHINYARFIADFPEAIDDSFLMTYAIAKNTSKVTAAQFIKLCKQIGSPLRPVQAKVKDLFSSRLIEEVFAVEEIVFNSAKIRNILKEKLHEKKITISCDTEVVTVRKDAEDLEVVCKNGDRYFAKKVFICTYARINAILSHSDLPMLSFKYELTEMPLITMPKHLTKFGVTIMDGPFFSVMPFPDRKMHSLHHVRYTPHMSWLDERDQQFDKKYLQSKYLYMYKDVQRYIPALKGISYNDALLEVKTVLTQNEGNDGRPILLRKDHGIKNVFIVLGGKIDNIYDIFNELQKDKEFSSLGDTSFL